MVLYTSPLQGFTDFRFRSVYEAHFTGIAAHVAPYLRLNGKGELMASRERDVLPENNRGTRIIPQIMAGDSATFRKLSAKLIELGYSSINWNLGCPYPMVAKRGMGSGLLPHPERIDRILDEFYKKAETGLSIKMRLGYENPDEIFRVLPVLERYPLEHICIHPRTGKQMYQGKADLEAFKACLDRSRHSIWYNGDIHSIDDYHAWQQGFPGIGHLMLGRGILYNPFLPAMILEDKSSLPVNYITRFSDFHDSLLESYAGALSGPRHLIQRMHQFWTYFIRLFPKSTKELKKIKKAGSMDQYRAVVSNILQEEYQNQ